MTSQHICYWTRRRRTLLTRQRATLQGWGVPVEVLEHAASLLNLPIKRRAKPDAEYDEEVYIGDVVAGLHDGCLVSIERATGELEAALVAGVGALHAGYLGRAFISGEVLAAVSARLRDGWSVEIEARPRAGLLRIRTFPAGAGRWTRWRAATLTFAIGPSDGVTAA